MYLLEKRIQQIQRSRQVTETVESTDSTNEWQNTSYLEIITMPKEIRVTIAKEDCNLEIEENNGFCNRRYQKTTNNKKDLCENITN